MVYRSKKDLWLFGLVWAAVLAPLAAGLFSVLGGNTGLGWVLLRVGVVTAAAVLLTTYPLNYEITSGDSSRVAASCAGACSSRRFRRCALRETPRARPHGLSTGYASST